MASRRPDRVASRAAATALAWTLFVGAWLVLGPLGRSTSALWFAGFGPVAAWLAVAGIASVSAGRRPLPRAVVAIALVATAAGLAIGLRSGSGVAVFVAAAGWGVLSCAVSRLAGGGRDMAFAPGCVQLPRALADPASWPALGARWSMLPMMAALSVQSDWCARIGVSPGQGVALHLAAMAVPAALLRLSPRLRVLQSPSWIAAVMTAGVAALPLLPGVRGWMAMSLVHALAWSLAWSRSLDGARAAARPADPSAWLALAPAAGLLALGMTIAAFGLDGLVAVHVALGALSLAGASSGWALDAWHHAHPEQEETLS